MTKMQELAAAFLHKAQTARQPPPAPTINAFQALFAVQELSEQEELSIEKILIDGTEPNQEGLDADAIEIKRLTKELKAIKRQELVLIGERIAAARLVFRKYQARCFREWMQFTFGSFKTGYNYLAFYDLYMALPEPLRERFKNMPSKAAYILASRKVPVEKKIDIVKDHSQASSQTLISLIQETLGAVQRTRRVSNDHLIALMERDASLLLPVQLNESQRNRLRQLAEHLKTLVEHS